MDSVFPGLEQIASALVTTTNLPLGYRGIPLFAQREMVSAMDSYRTKSGVVVVLDVSQPGTSDRLGLSEMLL